MIRRVWFMRKFNIKKYRKEIKKILNKLQEIEKLFRKRLNVIQTVAVTSLIIFIVIFVSARNDVYDDTLAIEQPQYKFLSDIDYLKAESSVGWGNITLDNNLDSKYNNGLITLNVDGKPKKFLKGIAAHATSTVIFDISNHQYDFFSTYYGIDASRGSSGNGVKFAISTSVDGENWELHTLVSPPIKKGNAEAEFLNIPIRGKNYIKLYCVDLGNKDSDHCVYGNAKLYNEGYVEDNTPYDFIETLDEYDKELKDMALEDVSIKEHRLLQRKFVSLFGYEYLQELAHLDLNRKAAIEWLMTDQDALRYYITGGVPIGSYTKSLNVLIDLFTTYKKDLQNKTKTDYTVLGDLYKRMMISLSLTHSSNVCLWVGGSQCSDAITRYAVYKKMRAQNLLVNKVFETLNIEEMRWVMNNNIDDEEIEWLNHHIRRFPTSTMPYNIDPYRYITYRFGYNYSLATYYDANNYDSWNEKYHLSDYHITYQVGKPKLWIVFEQGSVCGGLSKTGSNINGSLGNPSAVIGQPGHAAYLEYYESQDGKGMWTIKNNISGWTQSEKSERLLNGWGSNNWDSYYQVSYVPYGQEALNDIENYNKALETLLLIDFYPDDLNKQEEIYEKALTYQSIHMDAWVGLIRTYQKNKNKTAEDYINLAKRISESLYYFPLPMFDILNLINANLQGTKYYATFTNYLRMGLEKGSAVANDDKTVMQPAITRVMANYLLGKNDYSIASFSFDGDDANKIKLGSKFEGNGVRWDYSLDNGATWTATSESFVELTKEEIGKISVDNDIKIHIVGVDYSEANVYTIDITKASTPTNLYANDLENRVVGVNTTYEWRNSEDEAWTSYGVASPDNTGDKTLQVRIGATKTFLPSDVLTYTFTKDNQPDTRKYIPVSHLSVHSVSTQATNNAGSATYAIDGNYTTRWHSAWNGTDTERYIVIKLDRPVVLSAVEFVPAGGGNGKIIDGTIYGSSDGENWEELANQKNLTYTNSADTIEHAIANIKSFEIDEPKQVQYVKIVADRASRGNWFTARGFNFYQDITQNVHPIAGVGYDVTEATNQNVIARLINPSVPITITNNGGSDTYTFTENGEFTFEFVDEMGVKGSSKAKVDWIDKIAPTAKVSYSVNTATKEEVIATLTDLSEEVTLVNSKNEESDDDASSKDEEENPNANPFSYTFNANGTHTFVIMDKAGNVSEIDAVVDWIDLIPPQVELMYDINTLTNQNVTVSLVNENEEFVVLNNGGSKSYTFTENGEFIFSIADLAGNITEVEAVVGWIDKTSPVANVEYSSKDKSKNPVIAKLVGYNEDIIVLNNKGSMEYTFNRNGKFIFEIQDKAGNRNSIVAVVDWIESEKPVDPENPNEPTEPADPENPNEPTEPADPENPNEPTKPADPENPNEPTKPTDPENPNEPTKPADPEKPNEPTKPTDPENPNEPSNPEKQYKTYINGNFSLKVNTDYVKRNLIFKTRKITLPKEIKDKSKDLKYDYFEISLGDRITVEDMILKFQYPSENRLVGVYLVDKDNHLEKYEFTDVSGNTAEIQIKELGNYLFVYEDKIVQGKEELDQKIRIDYTLLVVIIILLIIMNIALIFARKKKQ